jgi:hypothetical protein
MMFAFGDSSKKLRVRGNQRQYDLPQYRPTYRRSDVYQATAGKLYMDPGSVTTPGGVPGGNQPEGIPEGQGWGNQTPPPYTAPPASTYTQVTGDRAIKTPTQLPAPQVIPSTNVDTTPVITPAPSVYTPVTGVRAVKGPTLNLYTPNTRGKY